MLIEAKFKITFNLAGEDVVDEGVEGAATIYEREEHKYVAEEKDFTQPQFFVAEEVKSILRNVEEGYTLIKNTNLLYTLFIIHINHTYFT